MENLPEFIQNILNSWSQMCVWLVAFLIIFGALYRLTPCNRGQFFQRRAFITDMGFYFLMPIFGRLVTSIYVGIGIMIFFRGVPPDEVFSNFQTGYGPAGELPIWLQSAIIFLVSDIILYWTHRLFHTSSFWPFHAIHHSSTQVEWHSTYRFHPVNVWLTFTLVDAIMMFIGFSLEAVSLMSIFNLLYSAMVHANLNWTFGPFRYIFSSPVFHRWHHTTQEAGLNKNFAPTFPLLDIVFGTFYMPENELPQHYGVNDKTMPITFLGQLIHPFRKKPK